jgi:hypothetical protein
MFQVLILVCSTAFSPAHCQRDTARQVIVGPVAQNEAMCAFYGQAYISSTAIGQLHRGEYVKVQCSRSSIGKSVGWLSRPWATPQMPVTPAG